MRPYLIALALGCGFAITACSSAPPIATGAPVSLLPSAAATAPAAPADPLAKLAAFTLADLQAASADAKAQTPPDTTASQCYDYLIQVIPTIQLPGVGSTVGAFVAFQKLRDLNAGLSGQKAGLKAMNLACAPLVIDTQTTVNKLLLIGGGAAGLPGLGGLGGLLP